MRSPTVALALLACSLLLTPRVTLAQQPDALVSRPGLFSYQIPPGWRVLTLAQIENPIATDPAQTETRPYIQVDTATSTASLADFTASDKKSMKSMIPSTEFLEQTPFVTTGGLQGIRIVATAHPGKHDQKAIYYLFDGPKNVKFIVFANVMAAGFEKNAPIFDAAIKTFQPQ